MLSYFIRSCVFALATAEFIGKINPAGFLNNLKANFGLTDRKDYSLKDTYKDDDLSEILVGHRKISYILSAQGKCAIVHTNANLGGYHAYPR